MQKDKNARHAYIREYYSRRLACFIKQLGGQCVECGSKDRLEFDHLARESKVKNVTALVLGSLTKAIKEVEKCQLLCHACHVQRTLQQQGIPAGGKHGGRYRYNYTGCRCELCRKANTDHQRRRK